MLQVANAPCSWGVIENIAGEHYDYACGIERRGI